MLSLSPEASSTLVIVMTQRLGFGSAGGRRREPGGAAGVRLRGRVSGRDARSRAASGRWPRTGGRATMHYESAAVGSGGSWGQGNCMLGRESNQSENG